MTLDEACDLARRIHASDVAELLAVGRFVPVATLNGSESWGVSVHPYPTVSQPTPQMQTVWSAAQWQSLCDQLASCQPAKAARERPSETQPTLF